MRLILVGTLALLVATPALSQTRQGPSGFGGSRAASTAYAGLAMLPPTSERICLTHKKTGKQVCKDRYGWRKEARRLARSEAK